MPTDLEPPEPYRSQPCQDLPCDLDLPYSDEQLYPEPINEHEPYGYAYSALARWYQDRSWVSVGNRLAIQYAVDGEHLSIESDVLVAFDVPQRESWSYIVWRERKPPDFVLDVPPAGVWRDMIDQRKAVYATLGVPEYWMLDLAEPAVAEPLTGYRLVDDQYEAIQPLPGTEGAFMSDVLRLELRVGPDGDFRFRNPGSGTDLLAKHAMPPSPDAFADALRTAASAYEREVAARRAAEARVAELEARLGECGG